MISRRVGGSSLFEARGNQTSWVVLSECGSQRQHDANPRLQLSLCFLGTEGDTRSGRKPEGECKRLFRPTTAEGWRRPRRRAKKKLELGGVARALSSHAHVHAHVHAHAAVPWVPLLPCRQCCSRGQSQAFQCRPTFHHSRAFPVSMRAHLGGQRPEWVEWATPGASSRVQVKILRQSGYSQRSSAHCAVASREGSDAGQWRDASLP